MYEINRSVFLLMPLEPFWRWLQSLPDVDLSDIELEDLQAMPTPIWSTLATAPMKCGKKSNDLMRKIHLVVLIAST